MNCSKYTLIPVPVGATLVPRRTQLDCWYYPASGLVSVGANLVPNRAIAKMQSVLVTFRQKPYSFTQALIVGGTRWISINGS
jgi:hypothetical protein